MRAVAQARAETVLRLVDRLLADGQNPTHFARQMVRFLRNAVVAKVAGGDSSLLQISSDERKRVAGVAELFSEEDLSRHLQIMLRTHGELGYRQEQRFHLELGCSKMAHAQRLLPIEQLLSEAAVQAGNAPASGPQARRRPRSRRRHRAPPQRSAPISFHRLPPIRRARVQPSRSCPREVIAKRVRGWWHRPRTAAPCNGRGGPSRNRAAVAELSPESHCRARSRAPGERATNAPAQIPDRLRDAVLNALGRRGSSRFGLDARRGRVAGGRQRIA